MKKFKKGDKVRVINLDNTGIVDCVPIGSEGIIHLVFDDIYMERPIAVKKLPFGEWMFSEHNLELLP